jgi:tRNA threonylcarbamoyladenosine biosynthesis protein TsaB
MPTILAIETSTELASAALLHGDRITVREATGVQNHSQTILPMVQALLEQAGIKLAQCDALAFGAGPGSFTGVRTACGLAQGLAFGAGLPLVPIVTLQAMAEACRQATGVDDVLTILDARMGEVYWARFRRVGHGGDAGEWQTVAEPALSLPSAVPDLADADLKTTIACGNGLSAYALAFAGKNFTQQALPGLMPHATQVAQLGRIALSQGRTVMARDAQPLYLRNKVALTTVERQAKAIA